MKKVSILLLLTVVLASFTFAIEGIGDFKAGLEVDFDNVSGGNGEALSINPLEITIEYSRSFGGLGLSAKLGNDLRIPTDKEKNGTDKIGDDLFFNVTPSYALAAGPGELGLSLGIQLNVPLTDEGYGLDDAYLEDGKSKNLFFRIDPVVSYGLDAGFGALAFELGTDHLQISKIHKDQKYGLDALPIYLKAGVELPFGLGIWLKPYIALNTDKDTYGDDGIDIFPKLVFDIHYAINEQITAGVETTIPTGSEDNSADIKGAGVEVIPYGEFSFGALGAYVKVDLTLIGAKDAADEARDIQIKPIIGVSYSF
jgi:hypothetical protein